MLLDLIVFRKFDEEYKFYRAAYDAVFPILISAVYSVHLIQTPVILHICVKKCCFYISAVWAGHVVHMGEGRVVHRVLVEKPEGKRPLGRPRRRWEDNIKMDLRKWEGVVGTGWSWLRIGTGGGHLRIR